MRTGNIKQGKGHKEQSRFSDRLQRNPEQTFSAREIIVLHFDFQSASWKFYPVVWGLK